MDEILIEEKRYVSSKRAAQITGYAKDYIGQLCREGRVPARLVGRSWYVLESAIQDHRFGKPEEGNAALSGESTGIREETFPRYEAVEAKILPSVNRLDDSAHGYGEEENAAPAAEQEPGAANSWKNWFDTAVLEPIQDMTSDKEAPMETAEEEATEQNEEVDIPIRAIHHPELRIERPQASEPIRTEVPIGASQDMTQSRGEPEPRAWQYQGALKATAILLAVCAVATAIMGSGYLDKYAGDFGSASVLAGITSVNK